MAVLQVIIFVTGVILLGFAAWLLLQEIRAQRRKVDPFKGSPFGEGERPSQLRRRLAEVYIPLIAELVGGEQAKDRFEEIFFQACADARARPGGGTGRENVEELLQKEKTDSVVRTTLEVKRADGVTDEDLRWWGQVHVVEKRMITKLLEFRKAQAWQDCREKDELPVDRVPYAIRERIPLFAETPEGAGPQDPHRPLPIELWQRVERYMRNLDREERMRIAEEARREGSMNAVLRGWAPFLARA